MSINEILVKIANEFHDRSLKACPCDYGGSVADIIEDELVNVLNKYATCGKVVWLGLNEGYGFVEYEGKDANE